MSTVIFYINVIKRLLDKFYNIRRVLSLVHESYTGLKSFRDYYFLKSRDRTVL